MHALTNRLPLTIQLLGIWSVRVYIHDKLNYDRIKVYVNCITYQSVCVSRRIPKSDPLPETAEIAKQQGQWVKGHRKMPLD